MENFTFLSSTRIIFGRGTELKVGEETAKYGKKVLMVYGGGSIKKTGLYDKIVKSLKDAGLEYIELSGVQPNPKKAFQFAGRTTVILYWLWAVAA